ncbi:MAG: hypothetical protein HOW97_11395 [Catenulispora sp.]|nr:hypothetical protein [Catenulispora sp.]
MTESDGFRKRFDALDATVRAALVLRYREDLSTAHVAQLVDAEPAEVEARIARALAELRDGGTPGASDSTAQTSAAAEEFLRHELALTPPDPELSPFQLLAAVRREQHLRRQHRARLTWRICAAVVSTAVIAGAVTLSMGRSADEGRTPPPSVPTTSRTAPPGPDRDVAVPVALPPTTSRTGLDTSLLFGDAADDKALIAKAVASWDRTSGHHRLVHALYATHDPAAAANGLLGYSVILEGTDDRGEQHSAWLTEPNGDPGDTGPFMTVRDDEARTTGRANNGVYLFLTRMPRDLKPNPYPTEFLACALAMQGNHIHLDTARAATTPADEDVAGLRMSSFQQIGMPDPYARVVLQTPGTTVVETLAENPPTS